VTQGQEPVGTVYAWILETKRVVVEQALRRRAPDDPASHVQRQVQEMVERINTCTWLLPDMHRFNAVAYRDGHLVKAIGILEDAHSRVPGDAYTLRHLMDLYVRAGRPEDAIDLEGEVETEGKVPAECSCPLGQAYLMLGDTERAIKLFEAAREHDPMHPLPYRLIAEACRAQGKHEEAAKHLRTAIERERARSRVNDERVIDTTILLGEALEAAGRPDRALNAYQSLFMRYPQVSKDRALVFQRIVALRRAQATPLASASTTTVAAAVPATPADA
jgi:tetratricopeptide (TPR) repeat protein